jgi:hypothetical protein
VGNREVEAEVRADPSMPHLLDPCAASKKSVEKMGSRGK